MNDIVQKLLDNDGRRLFGYIRAKTDNPHDAEDVFQQVVLTACEKREWLAARPNPVASLFTIAQNLTKDIFRRRKRFKTALHRKMSADGGPVVAGVGDDLLAHASDQENRLAFIECRHCLSDQQQRLFRYAIFGLDPATIAEVEGISVAVVRGRADSLKKRLLQLKPIRATWRRASRVLVRSLYHVEASARNPVKMWDDVALIHDFENWLAHPVFAQGLVQACTSVAKRYGPGSVCKGFDVTLPTLSAMALDNIDRVVQNLVQNGVHVYFRFLLPGTPSVGLDYLPGMFCGIGQHAGFRDKPSPYAHLFQDVNLSTKRDERPIINWPSVFTVPESRPASAMTALGETMVASDSDFRLVRHEILERGTGDLCITSTCHLNERLTELRRHVLAARTPASGQEVA